MRNQEAARYARWAAMAACATTLVVAAFYTERAVHGYLMRRHRPPAVPMNVQQQSAEFSYSDVEAGRTIFTVRASHATQFKDQDLAQLQDVWVTLYGRQGDRNDNIHTRECSYQPKAGTVECAGEVDIDIQNAIPPAGGSGGQPPAQSLHVTTSNLTFSRETGVASTPAPVKLSFAGGQGRGDGLHYDSHQSVVRVDHGIELQMAASERTGGLPVSATAANLEFQRDDRSIALGGPVMIKQGSRALSAEHVAIRLDQDYHAQTAAAEGHPSISATENGAQLTVGAERFEGSFDTAGALQHVTADGAVNGVRKNGAGEDHFSAAHVEFAMLPAGQLKDMTATGGIMAESRQGGSTRTLKTSALHVAFADSAKGSATAAMDKQHIENAETLGPATIESKAANESMELKAAKFVVDFNADGKIEKLLGHSGVQIARAPASGAAQTSTASELAVTFGPGGEWATLDESGNVQFTEGDRRATAAHARIVQAGDQIMLDGSPVISDATSETSAGAVEINQKTGEIRATGRVTSTELAEEPASKPASSAASKTAPAASAISFGEGAAHISADTLTGSTTSGHVTFQGHARLWQGQAVLEADRIEVWKDEGKLQASGNVVGVLPQAAGLMPQVPSAASKPSKQPASATKTPQTVSGTTLWQVRAPTLTYSGDQGKAHLEGGVKATSDQGAMQSKTLDVFLGPAGAASSLAAMGGRELDHVLAQGGVTISQGDLQASAEQAQYSATDGKFTLSGGEPTITDGSGNTTTGRSLTFYVASDTISVDSEKGSRTLTKHRVEK